jgi:hypothetical protein
MENMDVMGNEKEFKNDVKNVIMNVRFEKDNVVKVFEVNIRVIGEIIYEKEIRKIE